MATVNRGKLIFALKKAIQATFTWEKWQELGYLTETIDLINNHNRLLRSLYWKDDDYGGNILQVLPRMLGENDGNLGIVVEYVDLEGWLRANDPTLYSELYGEATTTALKHVQEIGQVHNVKELQQHAIRIQRGIESDPAQAIGSAKELLETVLKTVIGDHGAKIGDDIQELSKRAWRELGLLPNTPDESVPGADLFKRTLSNLVQIVVGVAEARNLYGTGHGKSKAPEPDPAHARLVVGSAVTVATFILEIWPKHQAALEQSADKEPF